MHDWDLPALILRNIIEDFPSRIYLLVATWQLSAQPRGSNTEFISFLGIIADCVIYETQYKTKMWVPLLKKRESSTTKVTYIYIYRDSACV